MIVEAARRTLNAALPGVFVAIEYIGSTAVPGLAAKAIIDLMAAATTLEAVVNQEATLATLSYRRYEHRHAQSALLLS